MAIDKIFKSSNVDDLADNILSEVDDFMVSVKQMQQRKASENVQTVIHALKKIETNIQDKYDNVTEVLEKRVSTIKDGRDGLNGTDGRSGRDGKPGRDGVNGKQGPPGTPGKDGTDGVDGVSVTNANIDFDGSLVISLSSGQQINVGEVVPPELERQLVELRQGGGSAGSSGDVMGPTASTDNAIVRFDGTDGKLVQNSVVTIADTTGNMTGVGTLTTSGDATIQGLTVGRGGGAVSGNTAVGLTALAGVNTGGSNVAVGDRALQSNTSGGDNTALGTLALSGNLIGAGNVAVGRSALQANTGSNNVAIGLEAGTSNTTASNLVAIGYQAARLNNTGSAVTAVGWQAAESNVSGGQIAAFGTSSLQLVTASQNTAFGAQTAVVLTSGSYNLAVGDFALNKATTSSSNTAVGSGALATTTTSGNSTAVGAGAGNLATGIGNQFFGNSSGSAVTTGAKNVILGSYTGSAAPISATGSNNIVLSDGDGNVRQVIDSSGNVGIGTSAPGALLDVSGAPAGSLSRFLNTTAPTLSNDTHAGEALFLRSGGTAGSGNVQAVLAFGKADGASIRSGSAIASVQTTADADQVGIGFYTSTSSSSAQTLAQAMLIDNAGNVGIGTTSITDFSGRILAINAASGAARIKLTTATSGTTSGDGGGITYDTSNILSLINRESDGVITFLLQAIERIRIDNSGNMQLQNGAVMPYAPAQTDISAAATLSNPNIQGQIISATGTTYTITMPTGTTLETLATWAAVNVAYDFYVINTATGTVTMAVNTGVTSLGLLTISAATSAHFRIRRTAANTFVLYRLV